MALDTVGYAVGEPLKVMAVEFYRILPKIFYAAIVVLFGYLLGWLLGNAVRHALKRMKFDEKFSKLHIAKPLEKIKISKLVGWVVKWYTFVVFTAAGASYISLYPFTDIMSKFAQWFPKLVIALAIGLVGAVVAEYVFKLVMHVKTNETKALANLAKYFILVVVVILALDQVIDISVLENVMLLLFAGISLGMALAIGISFGLALKDEANVWVDRYKKK